MNFIQLQKVLLTFNIKVNINNAQTSIDTKCNQYENYDVLVNNKDFFEYGTMIQERQNIPYFNCEKKFTNLNDATKYFFIDILSNQYKANTLLGTEFRKTLSLDIYKKQFHVEEFKKLMIENNISTNLLILDKKDIKKQHGILLIKDKNNNYCNAFIDKNGKIININKIYFQENTLFCIYKEIFMLNFFEKEVKPILEKENLYNEFTEEDVYRFVF